VRYTLLAALCWTRQAELVDGLVELLIGLIHRINARAERRVEKELIGEQVNVPGKRGIFTRLVDAALEHPDDTVRDALYPVAPGGANTLSALARERGFVAVMIRPLTDVQVRRSAGGTGGEGFLDCSGHLLGDAELVDHAGDDQATAVDVERGGVVVLVPVHGGGGSGRLLDFQGLLGAASVRGHLVAAAEFVL
jgi:hypothetical protein